MKCQNNVGFTLIELLVVVLIIGILAAVALPQYTKAVERSRTAEAIQRLGDMATAQQVIYMQNGTFANSYTGVNALGDITFPTSNDTGSYTIGVTGGGTGNDSVTLTATRNGGQYSGAKLSLAIESDGKITKTCSVAGATGAKKDEFCTLVKAAGYDD